MRSLDHQNIVKLEYFFYVMGERVSRASHGDLHIFMLLLRLTIMVVFPVFMIPCDHWILLLVYSAL